MHTLQSIDSREN